MAVRSCWHIPFRLVRLWRVYAQMDLLWMTRDLRFFLTCYLADALSCAAAVSATFLLAWRFDGIGAWSREQVIFLLGYAVTVRGIAATFFGFNILQISRRIGRGQLDHLLIQPQPIWLAIATDGFTPFSGSALLVPGCGLLAWAAWRMALPVLPLWLVVLLVNLVASTLLVLAFSFIWGSLAFWVPRGAEEMSSPAIELMEQLASFPLDGVGPFLLGLFSTVLPVGFTAWYPSRYLLDTGGGIASALGAPAAALVLLSIAVALFRKGMKHYEYTGSQRYLSFGHRN